MIVWPPGAGVGIVDEIARIDPGGNRLRCLRNLWSGASADADRVRKGIAETRAGLPRVGLPVTVIHGVDDGLIPMAFTSAPYVAHARAAGRDVRFWQVRNAQHFDAFLPLPGFAGHYVAMQPFLESAMDLMAARLRDSSRPLPPSQVVRRAIQAAPDADTITFEGGTLVIPP
mgnify:CR=1 FL=1